MLAFVANWLQGKCRLVPFLIGVRVEAKPRNVLIYRRPNGDEPYTVWSTEKEIKDKATILARINKVRRGLLGDYDDVGDGILELRFSGSGPGFRIYCVDDGNSVLLLCGGIKRTQNADIK